MWCSLGKIYTGNEVNRERVECPVHIIFASHTLCNILLIQERTDKLTDPTKKVGTKKKKVFRVYYIVVIK